MTETEIFKAIESHYGSGTLMAFADLIESENMTTYNTYQEAKIANPDRDIVTTSEKWSGDTGLVGSFKVRKNMADGDNSSYEISNYGWKICNPADYCMTAEQFLKDGNKFVDGDLVFDEPDLFIISDVRPVNGGNWFSTESANVPDIADSNRYIIRAAALEQPKHTKVEYVKVGVSSVFELNRDALIGGEYFYNDGDENDPSNFRVITCEQIILNSIKYGTLYRKVETEITERELVIEQAEKLTGEYGNPLIAELYDLGMLKPIEEV